MKIRPTPAVMACAAIAGLLFAMPGQAAFVASTTANAAGFTTNTTLTFNEAGLSSGVSVTNQYGGVAFSPGMFQQPRDCSGFAHMTNDCIGNFDGSGAINNPFTIVFDSAQTEAGFNMVTNDGDTLFEALLGSTLVESSTRTTGAPAADDLTAINFFGFKEITFDRIRVTAGGTGGAALIDNLTFDETEAPAPEPGSLALAGLALSALVLAARRRRPA
jgi:preprotein translocase subunit Sec61beta